MSAGTARPAHRAAAPVHRIARLLLVLVVALGWLAAATCPVEARRHSPSVPDVAVRELPREARETLEAIARGGPFRYERDGVVFGNRERILPIQRRGYYREYTVPTPGSRNRGARRIVVGDGGERYYTDDHYASFRRIRD